jgi:hypothetical protein
LFLSPTNAVFRFEMKAVKFTPILMAFLCAAATTAAAQVPLPRPRPAEAPADAVPAVAAQPPEPSACQTRLMADQLAEIEMLPPISGPGECGVADPVKLKEITLPDQSRVTVLPAPTLRCEMAEAVIHWVREDVTVEIGKIGGRLQALDNFDSYECRSRNRIAGAKISEHARGNALDVRGVKLASGRFVDLTDRTAPRDFREAIRRGVCARFTTVLGPGSDGYHENHIHLDLAERSNGYRLCRWAVLDPLPDIPLPRPRPSEASSVEDNPAEE